MKLFSAILGCAATLISSSTLPASQIAANWLTDTSGSLNGVSFNTTGFSSGVFDVLQTQNFSGADFSAAPVGVVQALAYSANVSWSVTFSSPVTNLYLIVDAWRGIYNFTGVDPTSTYTFNLPFSVASGLSGASVSGNTLSLPDFGASSSEGGFFNGVLLFTGPVTTLSVSAAAPNPGGQDLTFVTSSSTVPEPSSMLLMSVGAIASILFILRRKGKPTNAGSQTPH